MTERKWAWPCGAFSRNLKFRLLLFLIIICQIVLINLNFCFINFCFIIRSFFIFGALATTLKYIFWYLCENRRSQRYIIAFRTHKLDDCGHFEPPIERSTTIRSGDSKNDQAKMGVALWRVFPEPEIQAPFIFQLYI